MPDEATKLAPQEEHAPEEHLPEGENPINVPVHGLDGSPPQPNAPQQPGVAPQQDQHPLNPEPLLNKVEEKGGKQREHRNG